MAKSLRGGNRIGSGRNPSDDPKLIIPPMYIETSIVAKLTGVAKPTKKEAEAVRQMCYEFLKQEAKND